MKLSWGVALPYLCSAASAAGVGQVYINDPNSKATTQAPSSVTPETARLILAQRLGLSQFHSIKDASEEDILQINAFGGRRRALFGGNDAEKTQAHVLVWVDDMKDAEALTQYSTSWSSSFTIPEPPPTSDNDRLIQDMIDQATSLPKKADPKSNTYTTVMAIDNVLSKLKQPELFNDYLSVFRASKVDTFSTSQLAATLSTLREQSNEQGFPITVVVMPGSTATKKRSNNPYGVYELASPRRQVTEKPLTSTPVKSATPSDLETFPVVAAAEASSKPNSTTPVRGILPACFESLSDCSKRTNDCTGHGECTLLRKGGNGRKDCFACACKPEVKHLKDEGMEGRIKTTYWGGPACQKKDISMPFWLFVGSGVLLAFLISAGIGMLYSMGSEELPSVIGAGVSGPVKK